jgi:rsbT co-antagonist protein RsbR
VVDANYAERLRRIEDVLARVAQGDFASRLELGEHEDDLTNLEMGINFLIVDLRQQAQANREKEETLLAQQRELEAKLVTIDQQAAAIRELSTPVIEVWEDILVLPIVGVVVTRRSMEIMNDLLQRVVETRAKCVILDITGVQIVDTKTADYLVKVVSAAGMLGARCVLTGLGPAVAQTLVEIGADLRDVRTLRNLKAGLEDCLRWLRSERLTPVA